MPSEKTLKRIVIVLGILLVGGFTVIVATIIYRATNLAPVEKETVNAEEVSFGGVPDGAKILGGARNGKTIMFHLETKEGIEKVIVLDTATGELLGELEISNED